MSIYSDRLTAHLARYKSTRLSIQEDGVWVRTGQSYSHILPATRLEENVLSQVRDAFWSYARANGIRLHRDFHHLNSSQAFAFNLFFPFFRPGGDPPSLLRALGLPDRALASWAFEAVLDPAEGSNFDVHWTYVAGGAVACEVKLSEAGFGAARPDAAHLEKRERIYLPRLIGKVAPALLNEDEFFTHYQLLRNVAFADPAAAHHALFILPRANASLRTTLEAFVDGVVLPTLRPFVHIAFVEDILSDLAGTTVTPELATVVEELRAKYLLPAS
jgi:hypothetical protein